MASVDVSVTTGLLARKTSSDVHGGMSDRELLERFLDRSQQAAESAFELLVVRHGPMVLDVCRYILKDPHDAEDAFQATFLVLVRRAHSIRKRDSLGPWLHGVAHRIAVRSKWHAHQRRRRERQGAEMLAGSWEPDEVGHDLQPVLHEEINRLPRKYRAPIVLCYLQGHTHEEAAHQLQWPLGTVKGRLSRAREQLRLRLNRRGLVLPAGVLAWLLSPQGASAAVPAHLRDATVRAAMAAVSGRSAAAGAIPTRAERLAQSVLLTMALTRLRDTGLIAMLLIGGGLGLVWTLQPGGPPPAACSAPPPPEASTAAAAAPTACQLGGDSSM